MDPTIEAVRFGLVWFVPAEKQAALAELCKSKSPTEGGKKGGSRRRVWRPLDKYHFRGVDGRFCFHWISVAVILMPWPGRVISNQKASATTNRWTDGG